MFGIGHWEILLIVLVIFILFGHRLPSVMRSLGRGVVEFKEGLSGTGKDEVVEEKKDA
jgi:sec-independent protein translocase protein TatA